MKRFVKEYAEYKIKQLEKIKQDEERKIIIHKAITYLEYGLITTDECMRTIMEA